MTKEEVILKLKDIGLLAVVRVETIERGYEIAQGCLDGGVGALEISYTNNNAGTVIAALKEKFGDQLIVGAGTVLDGTTASGLFEAKLGHEEMEQQQDLRS